LQQSGLYEVFAENKQPQQRSDSESKLKLMYLHHRYISLTIFCMNYLKNIRKILMLPMLTLFNRELIDKLLIKSNQIKSNQIKSNQIY